MVDRALDQMYAENGRASVPPAHLLKACLLMALYSVRNERQFCERLEYDLLFKWFLDLNIMDHSFDHSMFAKNRSRLREAEVSREFLLGIVEQARRQGLLSAKHLEPKSIAGSGSISRVSAGHRGAGKAAGFAVGEAFQRGRDTASATGIDEAWASLKSYPARYTDLPPEDGSGNCGGLTTPQRWPPGQSAETEAD